MTNAIELVEKLRGRNFYLGGSRRMAEKYPDKIAQYIKPNTDWDFCCIDTKDNRQFLTDNGFEMCNPYGRSNYWDDLLIDIYKHPLHPIDILIRHDVKVYSSAFEALSAEVFLERLWKSSPLRDPRQPVEFFRKKVSEYFNGLFRLHGYSDRATPW